MVEIIDSCRMCLESKGDFINLECKLTSSSGTSSTLNYLEAYNFCTNLNADLSDPLPNIICEECANNLKFVFEVLEKTIRSDKLLREIIKKHNENEDQSVFQAEVEEILIDNSSEYLDHHSFDDEEYELVTEDQINDNNDVDIEHEEHEFNGCNEKSPLETEEPLPIVKSEDYKNSQEVNDTLELNCTICEEVFLNLDDLIQHYNVHDNKTQTKNETSSSTFQQEDSEKSKQISKTSTKNNPKSPKEPCPRNFCCEICGKFFTTKQKLNTHHFVHTKEKNFECPLCPKRHSTIFRHRDHLKTHENIRDFECEYCLEKFFSKSTLVCHLRRHTGERPFKCEICEKTFTQASILKTHYLLHTGKPVECDLCPKKFARPSQLILHKRTHTGERPYVCPHCPNRYRQKSHLDRHLDTHYGVKHTCEICGKNYSKKSTLNSHMFVHLEEKAFKCKECSMEFLTRDRYKRHLKNNHKISKTNDETQQTLEPNEDIS